MATEPCSSINASVILLPYLPTSGSKLDKWPSMICANTERITSLPGICTARVTKCRCMRGVMLNDPAVGFMHAMYCEFLISFRTILFLSYQPW